MKPQHPIDPRLARLAQFTYLLDQAFRVPGTRWRFGLEAVLGLVPGLGDTLGALFGAYTVLVARELGAPASLQLRMLVNLAIDAAAGAIPVAGDLFDAAFKAHVRNQRLLQDWLDAPHATRRSSLLLLLAGFGALLLMLAGTMWLAVTCVSWLLDSVTRA